MSVYLASTEAYCSVELFATNCGFLAVVVMLEAILVHWLRHSIKNLASRDSVRHLIELDLSCSVGCSPIVEGSNLIVGGAEPLLAGWQETSRPLGRCLRQDSPFGRWSSHGLLVSSRWSVLQFLAKLV